MILRTCYKIRNALGSDVKTNNCQKTRTAYMYVIYAISVLCKVLKFIIHYLYMIGYLEHKVYINT